MSELLPPEMELHKRQDAVLEAALAFRRAAWSLDAWLADQSSICRVPVKLWEPYNRTYNELSAACDALQAWHVENCK